MPILLKNKYIAFSSDPVVEMWVKPLSTSIRNILDVLTVFPFMSTLVSSS